MQIKDGEEADYAKYVELNSQDPYSGQVVKAGEAVGDVLDDAEKTPEEAIKALDGLGLSGYMAGAAIQIVCHYHPRGQELQVVWNKQWGGNGTEQGPINPAIITIDDSKPEEPKE